MEQEPNKETQFIFPWQDTGDGEHIVFSSGEDWNQY